MSVYFQPDTVLLNDRIGWGVWLQHHGDEHARFQTLARGKTPPATIPGYDLYSWYSQNREAVQSWLIEHELIHEALRVQANVTGVDLADVDLTNEEEFFVWLDDHASEHQALRSFYGAI